MPNGGGGMGVIGLSASSGVGEALHAAHVTNAMTIRNGRTRGDCRILGGMLVILFRSRLAAAAGDDYSKMAQAMAAHAKTFKGFVDMKAFKADDGERLTMVWWEDEETLRVWATDARHRAAQALGREKWYECYKIEVAQVIRANNFDRAPAATV